MREAGGLAGVGLYLTSNLYFSGCAAALAGEETGQCGASAEVFNVLLELLNSWKPGEVCFSISLVPVSSFLPLL